MPTINQLPSIDEVSGGNQIPTYYSGGGDARKMSVNLLQDYLEGSLVFEFVQYEAATVNGSVATTLGSVGPTGSTAGNPQGWIKIKIAGTDRYIPFW